MDPETILGTKLRSARQAADRKRKRYLRSTTGGKDRKPLTQSVVATHLGISQSYLSKVETGDQQPGFLIVQKMSAYYGIKVTQMSTLSDDERRQINELQFER